MNALKILVIGFFFYFFSGTATAQEITYSPAEGLFNDSQKEILSKAEQYLEKGSKKTKDADAIESKYSKPKKKKKKKDKASKFDKKTWEAKKLRIQAEKDFLKAYQSASTVYSEIVVGAEFYDDSDFTEATALNNDAVSLIEESEKKMSQYDKMVGDKKSLKKLPSSTLNSAINTANSLKESAYSKQKEALDLVLNQGRKKEADEADNAAWAIAESNNTIESYQDYIDNFPSGKYVSRARSMIKQLLAEIEKNKQVVVKSDYIFKVQIAASKTTLPNHELASKYKNTNEIEKVYSEYYYKYRVGSFTNYKQAAALRDQLLRSSVNDAFVVAFDKKGNQIEVTDNMKK